MNEKERELLVNEICLKLDEYVGSLFVDYHQAYEIKNGDVSPTDQIYLYERETQLAHAIVCTLSRQKKGE